MQSRLGGKSDEVVFLVFQKDSEQQFPGKGAKSGLKYMVGILVWQQEGS